MNIYLLQKFYKGECTAQEAEEVMCWFEGGKEKEKLLAELKSYWENFEGEEHPVYDHDASALRYKIQRRLNREENFQHPIRPTRVVDINRFYFLRIAAVLLLAVGLSFIMQVLTPGQEMEAPAAMIVKNALKGQKQTIHLPDGTRVTLNAESKLTYPEQFSPGQRQVTLEGEGFFEVARDPAKPFRVFTQDIVTTVLGTSFNVKAYESENDIGIAVATGKVKVENSKDKKAPVQYLEPGKAATYAANEQSFTISDFDWQATLGWKDGMLYFKEATLDEVTGTLERWYGVEIEWEGEEKQHWEYTGVFDNQSLENVLQGMGYVQHFTYEIKEKDVKIIFDQP